ncbi:RCC1 domain-containing protein RUG3, mitochondrial isoform X2 [Prosopis cineraria]|uniref:RCC1 domain-containing protein RUG3, mitochondrial isoform X2 n=1 Tax=Prosopis cineraria TaxID=364024 RepID=UPI00240EE9C1|nr:RCC1 domain-containing protein RUG3, mitochondrial isoform X2 [Prosopis cineraria]
MDIDDIFGIIRPMSVPRKSAIYVWGYNQSGQTGRKEDNDQLRIPKQLPPELFGCPAGLNARWLDVACGREHTAAAASDGSLFTWGANDFGQLGDGTENRSKYPKKNPVKGMVPSHLEGSGFGDRIRLQIFLAYFGVLLNLIREKGRTFTEISAAESTPNKPINIPQLASTKEGSEEGPELANNTNAGSEHMRLASSEQIICEVSCGAAHVVALSEDGLLQAWGYNEYGQLGRGVTCEGLQRAHIITAYAKFLDETPELVKITKVSCGEYHTAAMSDKGEVYTWGLGNMGQLGHSSLQYGDKELLPRRVVALDGVFVKNVACGGMHSCALTKEGALYAWGGGQAGQLGLGPQSGFFSCISNDSQAFFRNIPALVIPKGVQLAACGHCHTLISTRDGRIHGWGYNNYGQAANGKYTYAWYPSPVDWCVGEVRKLAAGGGHSAVLTDACSLKELCEFILADNLTLSNALEIEDVASRTGSDALARLCARLRIY